MLTFENLGKKNRHDGTYMPLFPEADRPLRSTQQVPRQQRLYNETLFEKRQ